MSNGANEVRLWDFRTLELRQTFKAADSIRFLRYDDTKLVAYLCIHTLSDRRRARWVRWLIDVLWTVGAKATSWKYGTWRASASTAYTWPATTPAA